MSKKPVVLELAKNLTGHVGSKLGQIRRLAGVTQAELAARLNIGQTALSKLEQRPDVLISTMREYLHAVGADLRIEALLPSSPEKFPGLNSTQGEQLPLPILGNVPPAERRDVIMSIKPKYTGKIVAGEKTVELRRRFPANVTAGTIILIYETSPTQALTGIAEISDVLTGPVSAIWKQFGRQACIERGDFLDYFAGTKNGFAIKLRGARKLSRSLDLQELRTRFNFEPPQSFLYASPKLREALAHECSKVLN